MDTFFRHFYNEHGRRVAEIREFYFLQTVLVIDVLEQAYGFIPIIQSNQRAIHSADACFYNRYI